jgi:hypothetical protein
MRMMVEIVVETGHEWTTAIHYFGTHSACGETRGSTQRGGSTPCVNGTPMLDMILTLYELGPVTYSGTPNGLRWVRWFANNYLAEYDRAQIPRDGIDALLTVVTEADLPALRVFKNLRG